jgi:hypothetical protein
LASKLENDELSRILEGFHFGDFGPTQSCVLRSENLRLECKERFDPDVDFLKIEEIFLRIKPEDVEHFKGEALKLGEGSGKGNLPKSA